MQDRAFDGASMTAAEVVEAKSDRIAFLTRETERTREEFVLAVFGALDQYGIRYCVLHSWDALPETLSSDLDLAVHPGDAHKVSLLFDALEQRGYAPVQVLNYAVNAYYFVFFWRDGATLGWAAVDIILEHRRAGLIAPSGEDLVEDRQRERSFWIPRPEAEFVYLLAKKTSKGHAPPSQAKRLQNLVEALGQDKAEKLATTLFLGPAASAAVHACAHGELEASLPDLQGQTWNTSVRRSPRKFLSYVFSDALRRVRRWLFPTGLFVTVLGVDGVGKSTLLHNLVEAIGPAFRKTRLFHGRPYLLWRRPAHGDSSRPHAQPPRGPWSSTLRVLAWSLDYWFGYWFTIRPILVRSGLVVFDRYFYDILVDPRRYRSSCPGWILRSLRLLIPKPDLILVLDAPSELALARKNELPLEELRRQRLLFAEYQKEPFEGKLVDASASPEAVTTEASLHTLAYLAKRFQSRRNGLIERAPGASRSSALKSGHSPADGELP